MNTFHFFEADREIVFDIAGSFSIMRQFHVIVETITVGADTQTEVQFHAGFFPILIPLAFCAGTNKELHFHLFKFTHTENELTGYDLISESLSDLCNTEWHFHATGFLHIPELHENT